MSGEWGYFSCCFYAQLLKMTEDFSLFDSICVIFIFQFFLKIIVYNLALFFFFSNISAEGHKGHWLRWDGGLKISP